MPEAENNTQKVLLMRLRRIEGQVRGVQRMIEDGSDCGEILNQIAAVKAAVNRVGILIFENHAKDCILRNVSQSPSDEEFKEIFTMMGRLLR
ncbi:metal-sensitive transcriptional regulator [Syntrophomonas palmitatica]|uniref:metal-sensitive transcriptional regulator n=1 Tax=Syntrophomonas palmitatica TaxID=402877 RepID=UPI0006D21CC2|nr:metal-sensitive transcriptional regulator [Syntrophomonas palmitatica]